MVCYFFISYYYLFTNFIMSSIIYFLDNWAGSILKSINHNSRSFNQLLEFAIYNFEPMFHIVGFFIELISSLFY
jgi:hypothetical protein